VLDETRVLALSAAVLRLVQAEQLVPPLDRENTLIVLNALGIAAAVVLAGTGPAGEAMNFFLDVIDQEVRAAVDEWRQRREAC
jgi:hypothetical protein